MGFSADGLESLERDGAEDGQATKIKTSRIDRPGWKGRLSLLGLGLGWV